MAHGEGRAAKKYAKALFELVTGTSGSDVIAELETLRQALKAISDIWVSNRDLKLAMTNPGLAVASRLSVLNTISERVFPQNERFRNFLSVLFENQRLSLLPSVSVAFGELVDELRKLLALQVTSAFELSSEEKGEIERAIQQQLGALGAASSVSWLVDSGLLGGLTIKIGDRLLDSSVRGSLERAKTQLV